MQSPKLLTHSPPAFFFKHHYKYILYEYLNIQYIKRKLLLNNNNKIVLASFILFDQHSNEGKFHKKETFWTKGYIFLFFKGNIRIGFIMMIKT